MQGRQQQQEVLIQQTVWPHLCHMRAGRGISGSCPSAKGHGAALHRCSYPTKWTHYRSSALSVDMDMAAMLPPN